MELQLERDINSGAKSLIFGGAWCGRPIDHPPLAFEIPPWVAPSSLLLMQCAVVLAW